MAHKVEPKVIMLTHTPDPENIVSLAAKLCYSSANVEDLKEKVDAKDQSKFVNRLMGMGHESPLEHVSFTFAIEGVSRAFLAQITRHRIASFSVSSQRYVNLNDFGYIVPPEIAALGSAAEEVYAKNMDIAQGAYNYYVDQLGNKGEKSNEDARFMLPNSAETRMIVTMNARELLHFFSLRCCNRAQWEIRNIAWEMLKLCKSVAPNIFENAGPSCIRGACKEGIKTCGSAYVKEKQNA